MIAAALGALIGVIACWASAYIPLVVRETGNWLQIKTETTMPLTIKCDVCYATNDTKSDVAALHCIDDTRIIQGGRIQCGCGVWEHNHRAVSHMYPIAQLLKLECGVIPNSELSPMN